jgi:trans-aconitate methyltransferase
MERIVATFSKISGTYEQTAVVQKSASDILLGILDIEETDDVLDLGCGPGHLTKRIREANRMGNVELTFYRIYLVAKVNT